MVPGATGCRAWGIGRAEGGPGALGARDSWTCRTPTTTANHHVYFTEARSQHNARLPPRLQRASSAGTLKPRGNWSPPASPHCGPQAVAARGSPSAYAGKHPHVGVRQAQARRAAICTAPPRAPAAAGVRGCALPTRFSSQWDVMPSYLHHISTAVRLAAQQLTQVSGKAACRATGAAPNAGSNPRRQHYDCMAWVRTSYQAPSPRPCRMNEALMQS